MPSQESVGTPFGPFTIFERLGVGGMASVHRALERMPSGDTRPVALKRLLTHLVDDEELVRSFVREARLASMLEHANIIRIHELGRVGGEYFISMEYIHGQDLRLLLKRARRAAGPPPIPVVLSLLTQLSSALDYAHRKCGDDGRPLGLVHRDISPSNLLVARSGRLKVIDFGIAKATLGQVATRTGRIKGKLSYMAPELFARGAKAADARSDLFSVGVIAHELCCALPLFSARDDFQTIQRVQQLEVEPPSRKNPGVPPELDRTILRALERDPALRWQSAADLLQALSEVAERYRLVATESEVARWCEWALGLPEPARSQARASSTAESIESAVQNAADEEEARRVWDAHAGSPVLLDDVPDVSHRHLDSDPHPNTILDSGAALTESSVTHVVPMLPEAAHDASGVADGLDDEDDDASTAVREPTGEGASDRGPGDDLLEDLDEATALTAAEGRHAPRTARGTQMPLPTPTESNASLSLSARPTRRDAPPADVPELPRISFRPPAAPPEPRPQVGGGADTPHPGSSPSIAAPDAGATHVPADARLPAADESQSLRRRIPVRARTETTVSELPPRPHEVSSQGAWADGTLPPPMIPHPTPTPPPMALDPTPTPTVGLAAPPAQPARRRYPLWLLAAGWVGALTLGVLVAALLFGGDDEEREVAPRKLASVSDAELRIHSEPADAVVYVDEMKTRGVIHVAAGTYAIRVEKDGYQPWRETVAVTGGEKMTLRVVLQPEVAPTSEDEQQSAEEAPVIIDALEAEVVDRGSLYVDPIPGAEVPHRLRTLICIDAEGAVTSVRIETQIPEEWRPRLGQRIKGWRYKPHEVDGVARRACFEAYPRVRVR